MQVASKGKRKKKMKRNRTRGPEIQSEVGYQRITKNMSTPFWWIKMEARYPALQSVCPTRSYVRKEILHALNDGSNKSICADLAST